MDFTTEEPREGVLSSRERPAPLPTGVVAICRKLDGLPLAIELAAARIKLFPPQALHVRLGKSLQLLTGGARDRPTRQQTLRNTIDWSYSLLSEEEQFAAARNEGRSMSLEGAVAYALEGIGAP